VNENVIFDDLSVLLFMGMPLLELIKFIDEMFGICKRNHLNVVILTHVCKGDEELELLNVILSYYMDVILTVEPLASGFTDGVDGQLKIIKGPNGMGKIIPGLLLYKVHETGVHWFTKGNRHI
jgi:hypothetical protein